MKRLKKTLIIFALIMAMLIPVGCGEKKTESWAYDYETYVKDDDSITLTDKDGNSVEHRYYMDSDKMVFYIASVYDYKGDGAPEGIVGNWESGRNIFRFTSEPSLEFSEEDIFYGHYSVDKDNSSIKLMYSDPIPDVTLYYSLDGNKLTIDYPWPLVKTQKEDTSKKEEGTE